MGYLICALLHLFGKLYGTLFFEDSPKKAALPFDQIILPEEA